jgi:hypothetical protein
MSQNSIFTKWLMHQLKTLKLLLRDREINAKKILSTCMYKKST